MGDFGEKSVCALVVVFPVDWVCVKTYRVLLKAADELVGVIAAAGVVCHDFACSPRLNITFGLATTAASAAPVSTGGEMR